MLPSQPSDNKANARDAYVHGPRNAHLLFTGSKAAADAANSAGVKPSVPVKFASGKLIRNRWRDMPPTFLCHVIQIFCLGSLRQMFRIEARRVVAGMKYVQRWIEGIWIGQCEGNSMNASLNPVSASNDAISSVIRFIGPLKAIVGIAVGLEHFWNLKRLARLAVPYTIVSRHLGFSFNLGCGGMAVDAVMPLSHSTSLAAV